MKYIMFEDEYGASHPVLFSDALTHSEFCQHIRRAASREGRHWTPVSAGFVDFSPEPVCHGGSESMKMESRESDAAYIYLGSAAASLPPINAQILMKAHMERKSKR